MAHHETTPATIVVAAMKLLKQFSRRAVAKRLGLSKRTVDLIARGLHRHQRDGTAVDLPRCTECGGKLVIVPCQACSLRNQAA